MDGSGGAVPPWGGNSGVPTCRSAGACQGGLAAPLAIPGIPGWLALRVPSSLATGLRSVIDAVSPSWLHIRSGYPCPRAKTGSGLLIPLHLRFGLDAAITGSTSCLATAPCARSSASQTGPTSKSKAQRPSWNLLPHPLLNKNLIKHDLGQTKPFPRKNDCASLETQKAQGACWR